MIFFVDNDSTLMKEETFDEVIRKVDPQLFEASAAYTHQSMNGGNITLEDTLRYRIDLLCNHSATISKKQLSEWSQEYSFSQGVEEFLNALLLRYGTLKNRFFILSGGFYESIAPKIETLSLSSHEKEIIKTQTYCNHFLWNDHEELIGIDWQKSQMWKEGAKRECIVSLSHSKNLPAESWVAIGDGSNDVGMIEDEKEGAFYAFVGNVYREKTVEAAFGKTITNFLEIPLV